LTGSAREFLQEVSPVSKIKYFFQQSWLLIVSSFLFGLLIAVTNASLEGRIKENLRSKLDNLMKELISDASDFKIAINQAQILGEKGKVIPTDIYQALDANKNIIGFAFEAVGAGFADKITIVIAVDGKFEKFLGFKVLSSNETPGFGSKIAEDDPASNEDLVDEFKGAPAGKVELVRTGKRRENDSQANDDKIIAISGATVSSEAVVKIFNTYTEKVKQMLQEKGLIGNGR
jgi:electron transport complex protein RnfG